MDEFIIDSKFTLQKKPRKGGWTYVTIPQITPKKQNPLGWVKVAER